MLAFATPAALFALGFLAVPIILHLWSRRTGRPQRVGNIAFFAAAPPPATRHPRIDDFWLLLLRCAVLTALVVALAGPYWGSSGRTSNATWVLADSASAADPRNEQLLDSLRSAGAELHMLGTGSIWSLLREADYVAPAGTRFVVVAPNRGAEGERPTLRAQTEWLVPAADPHPLAPSPLVRRGGTSRTVLVYSDASRREDARYVTTALRAAGEATRQPAVITQRDVAAPAGDADWFVWLAAQAVPDAVLERVRGGAILLSDAADAAPQNVAGRVRLAAASDPDAAGPLMRRRAADAGDAAPVWTDDAGRPVLALRREGAGLWLTFLARFHPSWGDLVLHPAFPEAVAALWAGDSVRTTGSADQAVALAQLLPGRDSTARGPAAAARVDLYHAFWFAGLLLFLLERWLARRARLVPA